MQHLDCKINVNDFLNYLRPWGKSTTIKYFAQCPKCSGKLAINPSNGTLYKCHAGCTAAEVRKALLSLAGGNDGYNEITSAKQAAKQKAKDQARKEAEYQKLQESMSEPQRHEEWLKIIAGTKLSANDREAMLKRGWTEEAIEASNARSLAKGRIIPIPNALGQYVGAQVHGINGKFWHATGTNQLKETGELPLCVVIPPNAVSSRIGFCESVLDKPHLAAVKMSSTMIGSSTLGSQPNDLARTLKTLTATTTNSGREIKFSFTLYPDGGSVSNPGVFGSYKKLHAQLKDLGYNLQVAWWGQLKKGGTDIDEIDTIGKPGHKRVEVKVITFDQFVEIAEKAALRKADDDLFAELSKLSDVPNETRNTKRLGALSLPLIGTLNFISSGCGTGKTHELHPLILEWIKKYPKSKIIDVTHRNSIKDGHQTRLGIPEYKVGFGNDAASMNYEQMISVCVDSILNLDISQIPANSMVIFDEVEAILAHLAQGGTLGSRTADVQKHIVGVINRVLATGGTFLGLEDSITDLSIKGMKSVLGGDLPHHLLLNTYEPFKWLVEIGSGHATGLVAYCIMLLGLAEVDYRICVPTSSRMFGEALERTVLLAMPEMEGKILRLDAKTAPLHPDVMRDPDAWIKEHKPRLVILSPTVESGFSIAEGNFTHRLAYFVNLGTRSHIQMLHRNRDNIETSIFCSDRGVGGNSLSADYRKLEKTARDTAQRVSTEQGTGSIIQTSIGAAFNKLSAQFKSRDVLCAKYLREYLTEELESRGHKVSERKWEESEEFSETYKKVKLEIELEENQLLFEGDISNMSVADALRILHSSNVTFDRKQCARKRLITEDLPGVELTFDFLLETYTRRRGGYAKELRLSNLLDKPDLALQQDREAWRTNCNAAHILWSRVTANKQRVDLITPILKMVQDLASGREYGGDDEAVKGISKHAIANSFDFFRLFQLNISAPGKDALGRETNSLLATTNKIIKKFGYKAEKVKAEGGRGNQSIVWHITDIADGEYRKKYYEGLDNKNKGWEDKPKIEIQPLSPPPPMPVTKADKIYKQREDSHKAATQAAVAIDHKIVEKDLLMLDQVSYVVEEIEGDDIILVNYENLEDYKILKVSDIKVVQQFDDIWFEIVIMTPPPAKSPVPRPNTPRPGNPKPVIPVPAKVQATAPAKPAGTISF